MTNRADAAIISGFHAALAGIALLDAVRDGEGRVIDFTFLAVNASGLRLLDRPESDVIGASVRAYPVFAGLRDPIGDYSAVVQTGVPLVDEFQLPARAGGGAPSGWVHRLVSRTPSGVHVVVRDISNDAFLRRSVDAFFELSADLMGLVSGEYLQRVNPSFQRTLGWTEAELLSNSVISFLHPDDVRAAYALAERGESRLPREGYESRWRCADGSYRWISWSWVFLRDGEIRYIIGRDVTERRKAEEAIRAQSALLQGVIENTPDVIFVKDVDGRYLVINAAGAGVHGRRVEDVIGRTDAEIAPHDAVRRRESDVRVMTLNRGETYEVEPGVSGGRRYWVITVPFRGGDGTLLGILGIARDITDQRRLETQVHQAQKMEAVGRLAGGIAHDFNNLLTAILSFAALAHEAVPDARKVRADLDEIRQAAEAAALLTRQMLAFSRQQVLASRPLLLNDVVQHADRILRSLVGEQVRIITSLDPRLAIVMADPGQIEQVLINLVVNAGHAMPDGGTLWVETTNVTVAARDPVRLPGLPAGKYVRLTVRDTGTGMDEATRVQVFEPFFTTKPEGKGTGLGLSCVYGIVKQSRGGVYVESELGVGSELTVYLPAAQSAVAAESGPLPRPSAPRAPSGHETVLLVEDNAAVRQAELRMLTEAGYRVLVAANGVEALEVFATVDGVLDLVVTDLLMPEMGGRALLGRLREDRPGLKALFISGYERTQANHTGGSPPAGTAFLGKPFTADAFLRAVRAMLDGVSD